MQTPILQLLGSPGEVAALRFKDGEIGTNSSLVLPGAGEAHQSKADPALPPDSYTRMPRSRMHRGELSTRSSV